MKTIQIKVAAIHSRRVVMLQIEINCPQYLSCIEPRYKTKGKVVYLLLTTPYKTMKKDRRFKVDHRILVAAAVLSIMFSIINFIQLREQDLGALIRPILMTLPLFVALRFPTMIYSTALAGIGAFFSVYFVFLFPFIVFDDQFESLGSVFMLSGIVSIICAGVSSAEAVKWIREIREKKRISDTEEGIDQMTKGLVKYLCPRQSTAVIVFLALMFLLYTDCNLIRNNMTVGIKDLSSLLLIVIPLAGSLIALLNIIKNLRSYNRYIKELETSVVLNLIVFDYYKGNSYLDGHATLGSRYIFVEGAGKVFEYDSMVKIYHGWQDGGKYPHWKLYAVEKDGSEFLLIELKYKRTKKNFDKYVLPMLKEIKSKNKDIVIDNPSEFRKW